MINLVTKVSGLYLLSRHPDVASSPQASMLAANRHLAS